MFIEMRSIIFFVVLVGTMRASLEERRTNRDTGNRGNFNDQESRTFALNNRPNSSGFIFHLLKHKLKHPLIEKIPTTEPTANCICVPFYQCNANNTIITDGAGVVDLRLINTIMYRRCTGDLEVCCRLPVPIVMPTTTTPRPTTPTTTTTTTTTTPRPTTTTTTTTTTTPRPTTTTTTTTTTTPRPTTTTTTTTTTTPRPTTTTTTTTTTTPRPTTTTTVPPALLCVCVPAAQCGSNGYVIVDGGGIINPRQTLNPCPIVGEVCCRLPISEVTTIPTPTTPPFTVAPVPTPAPTPAPIPLPLNCICVQRYQCDANGYIIISGAGSIDPRFPVSRQGQVAGTCVSATEICCRIPPTGDDSAFGTVVIPNPAPDIRYPGTSRACMCVKTWQCSEGNVVTVDGAGIIDPRFGACPVADEICCRIQGITRVLAPITGPLGPPIPIGIPSVLIVNGNPQNSPATSVVCGIKGNTCLNAQACATNPGETSFAEFPWMVALLIRKPDGTSVFQCGASMINTRTVLTAAHCVVNRPPGTLVARFGEWDTAHNNEPAPLQESEVQFVVTHPQHYNAGLYNDVAVLILATPVTYAVNVLPICMPQQGITFAAGTRCWATGWGRSAFEGQYQTILKKVELPIVDRPVCQDLLRATKLGRYFKLHGSFICAGGEVSKDTCRGDGGGALVCPTATGQYVQAGIVSWGIGCGETNTPAVYASVSQFRTWIDQQLATYGVL